MINVLAVATAITIPPLWAPLLAVLIPFFTAVVTRYRASTSFPQALIAFVAASVLVVVQLLLDDIPGDTLQQLFVAALTTFVPMVASYLSFWQPIVKVNEKVLPDKGI